MTLCERKHFLSITTSYMRSEEVILKKTRAESKWAILYHFASCNCASKDIALAMISPLLVLSLLCSLVEVHCQISMSISRSHNDTVYIGTQLLLTSLISLSDVDSMEVSVEITWTKGSDVISMTLILQSQQSVETALDTRPLSHFLLLPSLMEDPSLPLSQSLVHFRL